MKKCLLENKHAKQAKNVEHCVFCKKKIGLSYKERVQKRVDLVPYLVKQKILDLLHSGKTVGEALDESGIKDRDAGYEIINQNIDSVHFLRNTAL